MHTYAQTNVQLFNQLRSDGYSKKERACLLNSYEFGMRIFTGLYLASGKPFIDHLVGTASILASLHAPVEVVAAGLLHAAYLHGDFGSIRKGVSKAKREQVRRAVGEQIEEYIARYDRLPLGLQKTAALHNRFDDLDTLDHTVLLMRLANQLEHHLDLGALYFPGEKEQQGHQRYMEAYGPLVVTMAERLGCSSLAAELRMALGRIAAVEPPLEPCVRCKDTSAYLIAPGSYCQWFSVTSWRKLSVAYGASFLLLRRAKRLCGRVFRCIYNVTQSPSRSA
jgi:(p)ppGpp synthase/HD superfamily hydrolase